LKGRSLNNEPAIREMTYDMRVQVLGASGGIGGTARTTSFLVDDDILLDAGTGLGDLSLAAMERIDHVFLTHSHLDHVACLPFMMDTVGAARGKPITVHSQQATLDGLRAHLFNGVLWPDFARLPTAEAPFMKYETVVAGTDYPIGARRIRGIPVSHIVPAIGYLVRGAQGSIAFSGDTTTTDEFWRVLNDCDDLKHVIIEASFLDNEESLARISKHMCPKILVDDLKKLKAGPQVHITHLMPGEEDAIMAEIAHYVPRNTPRRLSRGDVIEC
jgi:ribonuclease BN (tRNA processing enzyme)